MTVTARSTSLLLRHPRAVLSHEEAARRLGIELLEDDGTTRLTVPRNRGRIVAPGWRVHRADLAPDEIQLLSDGSLVTAPMRTVADLGRVLSLQQAVVSADSALRLELASVAELKTALRSARGQGSGRLRQVSELVDPLSGSVLESLLRVVLVTAGLPVPKTQYWIQDGSQLLTRVDFCWPDRRLIVEADGFAFHSDRAAYRRDRERMNRLEQLGWRVLRFTWEDVRRRPDHVIGVVRGCLGAVAA